MTADDGDRLAEAFEAERPRLWSVAHRMLGSGPDADDAVQEAWLRLQRTDGIDNLGGWLTTVVSRVCLDMLRSRSSRREDDLARVEDAPLADDAAGHPALEAELADAVGSALLVVLQSLGPAERLAFVLHDTFGVGFDDIAVIIGRSPAATRQLASRARRRVRGQQPADQGAERAVVDAFLAASRSGDFERLLTLLDPDAVVRADAAAVQMGSEALVTRRTLGRGDLRREGPRGPARRDRRFARTGVGSRRRDQGRLRVHGRRRPDHRDRADRRSRRTRSRPHPRRAAVTRCS